MSIQDEAYSEAMDEIARLRNVIYSLEKLNQMTDDEVVLNLKAEITTLKAILTRAADALEDWSQSPASCRLLIAELRKAAK